MSRQRRHRKALKIRSRRLTLEALEDRTLLDAGLVDAAILRPHQDALLGGLRGLADWFEVLDSHSRLAQSLPIAGTALGQALDGADALKRGLYDPVVAYFAADSTPTTGELGAVLTSLSQTLGPLQILVDPSLVSSGRATSLTADELQFSLKFQAVRTGSVGVDLGASAASQGLSVDAAATIPLSAGLSFPFTFGVDLTPERPPSQAFFIRTTGPVQVSGDVHVADLSFDGRIGFLDIAVAQGVLDLDADVSINLANPDGDPRGNVTLAELRQTPVGSLATLATSGSVSAVLPVAVDLGSFALLGSPTVSVAVPDVFSGTVPTVSLNADCDPLLKFRNITPQDVLNLLGQLSGWLEQFGGSAVFHVPIPFVQGKQLGDVLDLAGALRTRLTRLLESSPGTPGFASAQDLAAKIAAALGVDYSAIAPDYNATTNELTWQIHVVHPTGPVTVAIDLGADLGRLGGISTSSTLSLTASATLDFTLGLDLSALAGTETLADRFFIEDASLSGAVAFTAADIDASARFGFLGVSVTNGTGSASGGVELRLVDPDAAASAGAGTRGLLGAGMAAAAAGSTREGKITLAKLRKATAKDPHALVRAPAAAVAHTSSPDVNVSPRTIGNQVEPTIAVDPTNPQRLFAASNHIGPGIYVARSDTGGASWTPQNLGTGGDGLPAAWSDPSAAFDQFGNLYLAYLTMAQDKVVVLLSVDAGKTFVVLKEFSGKVDRPTITTGAGGTVAPASVWVVYRDAAYWDVVDGFKPGILAAGAPVTGKATVTLGGIVENIGVFRSQQHADGSAIANFAAIAVGPDGQVMVVGQSADASRPQGPSLIRSYLDPDGLGPQGFAPGPFVLSTQVGPEDTIPAQPDRNIDAAPTLAYDYSPLHRGRVYLAYTNEVVTGKAPKTEETNDTNVFVIYSDDGTTKGPAAPIRVNNDKSGKNSQFFPHLDVDPKTGHVAVSWYDARNAGAANNTVEYWAAVSTDGITFDNFRVSDGTSNQALADPRGPGPSMDFGDYTNLAFYDGKLYPIWADNSNSTGDNVPNGPLKQFDIYTETITLTPAGGKSSGLRGLAPLELAAASSSAAVAFTGSAQLVLPIRVNAGFVTLPAGKSPTITVAVPDLSNPADVRVTFTDMEALLDFETFSFTDVVQALKQVKDYLQTLSGFGFLGAKLPGVDLSVSDLIDYADKFAARLEALSNDPQQTIQEVEAALKRAFGLPASSPLIGLSLDGRALRVDLQFSAKYDSGPRALNLDLAALASRVSGGVPSALKDVASLIDLSTTGTVAVTAEAILDLDFGIDLSTPLAPRPFVYDTTGLALTAGLHASALNFTAAVGPLGLFVKDGTAVLDRDGTGPLNDPATFTVGVKDDPVDHRYYFGTGAGNEVTTGIVDVDLVGGANLDLPLFFPTKTAPLGGAGSNALAVDVPSLKDLLEGKSGSVTISTPDIQAEFGLLDLLNNLGVVIDGLDALLAGLQNALDGEVFGVRLPLVGDKLKGGAQFVKGFREDVLAQLHRLLDGAATKGIDLVQQALFNALGPGGLKLLVLDKDFDDAGSDSIPDTVADHHDVAWETKDSGNALQFNLHLHKNLATVNVPLDFDIGVPALGIGLAVPPGSQLSLNLGFDFQFAFGVSKSDGFYCDTSRTNELTVNLDVALPDAAFSGRLGILRLEAQDGAMVGGVEVPTSFTGKFTVDFQDPIGSNDRLTFGDLTSGGLDFADVVSATFWGNADVNLHANLNFGEAAEFPRLEADFLLDWTFGNPGDSTDPGVPTNVPDDQFGTLSLVKFDNIKLDAGSFFGKFVHPVLDHVNAVLAPIQPIRNVLTARLPVLSDIGVVRSQLDYDPPGDEPPDGKVTLLDLARKLPVAPPALEFIDAFDDFLDAVGKVPTVDAGTLINLGSFEINPTARGAATLSEGDLLHELEGSPLGQLAGEARTFLEELKSEETIKGTGLHFPIFEEPAKVFRLFIGQNVPLFTFDMPPLSFDFEMELPFPLLSVGPVILGVTLVGGLGVQADFAFGYDTYGMRQLAEKGFDAGQLGLLKNGFYVSDRANADGSGDDVPEVTLTGRIDAYGTIDAGLAVAGVGGGLTATVEGNLNDQDGDGKVRLDEIVANLPTCLLDIHGELTAGLKAFVKLRFPPARKQFNIATVTLLEFDYGCAHGDEDTQAPILAERDPGTGLLKLNMGPRAGRRLRGDTIDGDEVFTVTHTGGVAGNETVEVTAFGLRPQSFSGVSRIEAHGGDGQDTIVLQGVLSAAELWGDGGAGGADGDDHLSADAGVVTLHGGGGQDELTGGAGPDSLDGGSGADTLLGHDGQDTLDGGTGNDLLDSGEQNDTLRGGSGDDVLTGGEGNDSLDGGADNDDLAGDEGADSLLGGTGHDTLFGGADADSLQGNGGNDQLYGEAGEDTLTGGAGTDVLSGGTENDRLSGEGDADTLTGDAGADTLDGGEGADQLEGGEGADRLSGGSEADSLQGGPGDDSLFGDAGPDWLSGDAGDDHLEGGSGNDMLSGGANDDRLIGGSPGWAAADGDDVLDGDAGNDLLIGDNGSVGAGAVVVLSGGSGRDTLRGGSGNDTLYGQGGGDQLQGGAENDTLQGGAGNDLLTADGGNDLLAGEEGADTLVGGTGDDTLSGGADSDAYVFAGGPLGSDQVIEYGCCTDSDTLDYSFFSGSVNLDLAVAAPQVVHPLYLTVTLLTAPGTPAGTGIENVVGGAFNDTLLGNLCDNLLDGQGGHDTLVGRNGDDVLIGGLGNDRLDGGDGWDVLFGDQGVARKVEHAIPLASLPLPAASEPVSVLAASGMDFFSPLAQDTGGGSSAHDTLDCIDESQDSVGGPSGDYVFAGQTNPGPSQLAGVVLPGLYAAAGDVTGDGKADLVTAPTFGTGGVQVHDGATGTLLHSLFPYGPLYAGGITVAAGDLDGDGKADILVAPASFNGLVQVYSGATGELVRHFLPADLDISHGLTVAAGDVDGDGRADVILGEGPGAGTHVAMYSGADGTLLRAFDADPWGTGSGVFVAAGDVDGDGMADVITGPITHGSRVRVWSGADGTLLKTLTPFRDSLGQEVVQPMTVAAADVDGDGKADAIIGTGLGGPMVKAISVLDCRLIKECVPVFGSTSEQALFSQVIDTSNDLGYGSGVAVAAGDVTGDGRADFFGTAVTGGLAAVLLDGATCLPIPRALAYFDQTVGAVGELTETGTDGDLILVGSAGDDTLFGGSGDDLLFGDNGIVVLAGVAVAAADPLAPATTLSELSGGDPQFVAASATDFFSNATDTPPGGSSDGSTVPYPIIGFLGNLTQTGVTGDVLVSGAGGDDSLFGDDGDDVLIGDSGAVVRTSLLLVTGAAACPDEGGIVSDTATSQSLALAEVEDTQIGTAASDVDPGTSNTLAPMVVAGLVGNLTQTGVAGDVSVLGGNGDDTGFGGAGQDTLIGGNGVVVQAVVGFRHEPPAGSGSGGGVSLSQSLGTVTGLATLGVHGMVAQMGVGGSVWLEGGADQDSLTGETGDDAIVGDSAAVVDVRATLHSSLVQAVQEGSLGGEPILTSGASLTALAGTLSQTGVGGGVALDTGAGDDPWLVGSDGKDRVTGDNAVLVAVRVVLNEEAVQGSMTPTALVSGSLTLTVSDIGEGSIVPVPAMTANVTQTGVVGDVDLDGQAGREPSLQGSAGNDTLTGDNALLVLDEVRPGGAAGLGGTGGGLVGDVTQTGVAGTAAISTAGAGPDTLFGHLGDDLLAGDNAAVVALATGGVSLSGTLTQTGVGVDVRLTGATAADSLAGHNDRDVIFGDDAIVVLASQAAAGMASDPQTGVGGDVVLTAHGGGQDTLDASLGSGARLFGDSGVAVLLARGSGGGGAQTGVAGDMTVTAGGGDDSLAGSTDFFLGAGNDVLAGDNAVYVDLDASIPGGGAVVRGVAGRTSLDGGAGHDVLAGAGGDDLMAGDNLVSVSAFLPAPSDRVTLRGGAGHDTLDGGSARVQNLLVGDNALVLGSGALPAGSPASLIARNGEDSLLGGANSDVLFGDNVINPAGGSEPDGRNVSVTGGLGRDTLLGGAGDDSLYGQDGIDRLDGGGGRNRLAGGTGDDLFLFRHAAEAPRDTVSDTAGSDRLDFSAFTAGVTLNLDLLGVEQALPGGGTLMLTGQVENFTGGSGNDTVTVRGLAVPRAIEGGPHAANPPGDTLLIDALVQAATVAGRTVTVDGLAPITHSTVETVRFLNLGYANYVVLTTADGDFGSLRQALLDANVSHGTLERDRITFAIPGAGVRTLRPASALPAVTDPVLIDATTQPGYVDRPVIDLDGSDLAGPVDGLTITAAGSTIRGLAIHDFPGSGIGLTGPGNNVIEGNYLGTDAAGAAGRGNQGSGVTVSAGTGNRIGGPTMAQRNVISGNRASGVTLATPSSGTTVEGNFIGTDTAGLAALANARNGMFIIASRDNLVAGNLVSGNTFSGLEILGAPATGNVVQGNFIGTNVTGTAPLPNHVDGGVFLSDAPGNTIGGTTAAARNLISGNEGNGVYLAGLGATSNVVQGNFIGTNVTGTAALGNLYAGVALAFAASLNRIGGAAGAAGNLISGNRADGVFLEGPGTANNLVQGNLIGTDVAGQPSLGNAADGVHLRGAGPNQVGGRTSGEGNTIAGNAKSGVSVVFFMEGTGNTVAGNAIYGNGGLGIDLGSDGVTPNDPGDTDAGPNAFQNFPTLRAARPGASTRVVGTLDSTPAATFTLDFFASTVPDPSGFGEGRRYLGSTVVTTDAAGTARFAVVVPGGSSAGEVITATATDAAGDTSEFSPAVAVDATPPTVLEVARVSPDPRNTPVASLEVEFSEAIDPATFTVGGLVLTRNGTGNLVTDAVGISSLTDSRYRVSLPASLTGTDGTYVLAVAASAVRDVAGNAGVGAGSAGWLMDTLAPVSRVNALPPGQGTLSFTVGVTGSDPPPAPGVAVAGVASYDLYVAVDGAAFVPWTTVPAASPTATYQAASNHTYAFHAMARDAAGNVESKPAALIEASTYVPDLTPPDTRVTSAGGGGPAWTVAFSGSDTGGSGLAWFDLFVAVDGGAARSVGRFLAGPPVGGVVSGQATYQATADGASHQYRFWTTGTDGNGNSEAAPAAPADVTVTATYAPPPALAVTAFAVQKGLRERSYIRYLDLTFSTTTGLAALLNPAGGRVALTRYELNGSGSGQAVPLATPGLTGSVASYDFGAGGLTAGIGGTARSSVGDGYYVLALDVDGNGSRETQYRFYRLLGDVFRGSKNGVSSDRTVNTDDVAAVTAALNRTGALLEEDVDGDGVVTNMDKTLAMQMRGRSLAPALPLDALVLDGPAREGAGLPALSAAEVGPVVVQAARMWRQAGLADERVRTLEQAEVAVADLPGALLALESPARIVLDRDAAGLGWFVDATPAADEEFIQAAGGLAARPDGPAAGQVDLLTVLVHEMGHLLGLDDEAGPEGVMGERLAVGVRRGPDERDGLAVQGSAAGQSGDGPSDLAPASSGDWSPVARGTGKWRLMAAAVAADRAGRPAAGPGGQPAGAVRVERQPAAVLPPSDPAAQGRSGGPALVSGEAGAPFRPGTGRPEGLDAALVDALFVRLGRREDAPVGLAAGGWLEASG